MPIILGTILRIITLGIYGLYIKIKENKMLKEIPKKLKAEVDACKRIQPNLKWK